MTAPVSSPRQLSRWCSTPSRHLPGLPYSRSTYLLMFQSFWHCTHTVSYFQAYMCGSIAVVDAWGSMVHLLSLVPLIVGSNFGAFAKMSPLHLPANSLRQCLLGPRTSQPPNTNRLTDMPAYSTPRSTRSHRYWSHWLCRSHILLAPSSGIPCASATPSFAFPSC